mgnify:CR=1 FL=1
MKNITIKKIKHAYKDKRGVITDLLNEKVNHIGLITTKKSYVRANHYHKLSTQYSYIFSGKFEVSIAKHNKPLAVKKYILNQGEIITIPPLNIHKFKAIKDSVMIDIVSESRAGKKYEDDVIRVELK